MVKGAPQGVVKERGLGMQGDLLSTTGGWGSEEGLWHICLHQSGN